MLEDVDLWVPRGRFVSVVGPSGCGKSSLLNLIVGLTSPTHGQVEVFASPVDGPRPDVHVFQPDVLLPWKTLEQNVALGPLLTGAGPRTPTPIRSVAG